VIKLVINTNVYGFEVSLPQIPIKLEIKAPIAIPGQADLPSKIISAKATPDGGQTDSEEEPENERKYPS
jgi:hypothetical protein